MMPVYRTDDGRGWMHVNFGRKRGPLPCAAPRLEADDARVGAKCGRMGGNLCDAVVGQDLAGKPLTCDMPLCGLHATHVNEQDRDYCPRHAHLAKA
jgi:hypothetical protein